MAQYIARVSWGNDSVALVQMLKEHGLKNVICAYSKTGWASPEWAERVEQAETWARSIGFQCVQIESDGFEHMVLTQTAGGMFPTRMRKFCTKYLKILPFLKWVESYDPEKLALVCVGKRRAESEARKNAPAFAPEQDGGRHVWYPIIEFSDVDRDAMIAKTPMPVLPHRSDECEICIMSNRTDLRRASEFSIARLERLEADVGRPMFDPKGKMGATGIRQVIDWAASERGEYVAPDTSLDETCTDEWCGT